MYEDLTPSRAQTLQRMRDLSTENDYEMENRGYFSPEDAENPPEEMLRRILTKTRLLLAVLLTAAVILMDLSGRKIGGLTAERIFQAMAPDYEQVITQKLTGLFLSVSQAPR